MRRDAKASSASATTVSRTGSNRARRAVLGAASLCALGLLAFLGIGTSAAMATPPTLTINPVTNVGFASAHLSGEVEVAADGYETYWCLEYAEEGTLNWSGFCYHGPIQPGETASVERDLSGLKPGTHYEARLSALNFTEFIEEHSGVQTFTTEATNPPEAEIDPASAITGSSAHLSGTVNSGGSGPGEKAGTYSFTCSPSCPSAEGSHNFQSEGFADGADHAISADATGLLPNTQYTATLTAQNAAGEESDQTVFTTDAIGPEAITAFVAPRTTSTARLNAYITPNNSDTTFYFQYGPSDCSANPCTSVPLSEDASVEGADLESHLVSQEVEGLSESTIYHYRVVAENSAGTAVGADKTFETRSAAEMVLAPRGYELVNPPDKGNQHVLPLPLTERYYDSLFSTTPNGEAAGWMTFAGAPGGTTSAKNPFLSTRGSDGWTSESMVGPASKQFGGGDMNFNFIAASPDLSHFLFFADEGILTSPDTAVLRGDREGNEKVLLYLPNQNALFLILGIERSSDLKHVLMVKDEHLYDYGDGTPEEVGLMADDQPPACGINSLSGFYHATHHWIATTDASRVFFKTSGDDCGAPAGLYVRNRETEDTTELTPEGDLIQATPDGRTAVFRTTRALNGEDTNLVADLYQWSESSGVKCLTCSLPNADAQPNVKTADDLSRIYFSSSDELLPGEDKGKGGGTYVILRDGSVHFAGPVGFEVSALRLTPSGRAGIFKSAAHLTDDDIAPQCARTYFVGTQHPCNEIYYYSDETRSIECISCVHDGITRYDAGYYNWEISDDGSTAIFDTPEKLVPEDVNGGLDVYQWHNGKVGLITDGVTKFPGAEPDALQPSNDPMIAGISADGRDIFFAAAAPLTGFEQDGLLNLYDARIGGGFPPPTPQVHCDGDSCQGSLEVQPGPVRSASSTFQGNGNVAAAGKTRCRKAKVRRKGRCVSKRPSCPKQAKAKKRCAKPKASANRKRAQRDHQGGSK